MARDAPFRDASVRWRRHRLTRAFAAISATLDDGTTRIVMDAPAATKTAARGCMCSTCSTQPVPMCRRYSATDPSGLVAFRSGEYDLPAGPRCRQCGCTYGDDIATLVRIQAASRPGLLPE